ncbi:MAG: hypothetical protein JWL72_3846 [Ilumatobacteraceae bacterium]|nr:hypothetical protein [Ilumatobacteraceae bacterium]MCU1390508.1 hypothetical protein [Ilumatobacteraceae bacterium]
MTPPLDVALSFAGEQREYVRAVAAVLKDRGVRYFFDEENRVEVWGRNMHDVVDATYRHRALYVVMFVSADYKAKVWPNLERQTAQSRAMTQDEPYILPVRFDDTDLPGLLPTTIYEDARTTPAEEIGALIVAKVAQTRPDDDPAADDRGIGWEYMLLADSLRASLDGYDGAWRSHVAHHAEPGATTVAGDDVGKDIGRRTDVMRKILGNVNRAFEPESIERAVGADGEPGDPIEIQHLAGRMIDSYGAIMAWAADARGALVPDEAEPTYEALAVMADQPLNEIRAFVDEIGGVRDQIIAVRNDPNAAPVVLEYHLKITVDEAALAHCLALHRAFVSNR